MTGLVPIRALALGAPGREPDLTGRPFMTAPQADIEAEMNGRHASARILAAAYNGHTI